MERWRDGGGGMEGFIEVGGVSRVMGVSEAGKVLVEWVYVNPKVVGG